MWKAETLWKASCCANDNSINGSSGGNETFATLSQTSRQSHAGEHYENSSGWLGFCFGSLATRKIGRRKEFLPQWLELIDASSPRKDWIIDGSVRLSLAVARFAACNCTCFWGSLEHYFDFNTRNSHLMKIKIDEHRQTKLFGEAEPMLMLCSRSRFQRVVTANN